jgi:hypothetical protein
MPNTERTPGPWQVGSQSKIDGIVLPDDIASVVHWANPAVCYTVCELATNADARLIAAAPALLAALEEARDVIGADMSYDFNGCACGAYADSLMTIDAAIAQAKGE